MRAGAGNIIWPVVSSNFRRYLPVRHLLPSAHWICRAALHTPGKCLYMDKSKIGAGMHFEQIPELLAAEKALGIPLPPG